MSRSSLNHKLKPDDGGAREDVVARAAVDESITWLDDSEDEAVVREELSQPDHADYALITDYLAGELSSEEEARVKERLRSDPQFHALAAPLLMVWNLPGRRNREPDLADDKYAELIWEKVKERIELTKLGIHTPTSAEKRTRRRWILGILTGIAVVIAATVVVQLRSRLAPSPTLVVHVDAPANAERFIRLPDETQVTLAPRSHLSYGRWFGDPNNDTLRIDGEATFAVARSPRRPLIVLGHGVEVSVSEGQFTIHSFAAEAYTYVEVHAGVAQVLPRTRFRAGELLTLRAGERARVGPGLHLGRPGLPIAPSGITTEGGKTHQPRR